jgi:uncharacterized membrane protein YdjX (TVP38/TMEM64 family)
MGADSECDLVVEAKSDGERRLIAGIRNRLLGHFCGVSEAVVESRLIADPSLIAAASELKHGGHSLQPVEDGIPDAKQLVDFVTPVADPLRPLGLERAARATAPVSLKLVGVVLAICALAAIWRFTPLYRYTDVATLLQALRSFEGTASAPFVIVGAFVVGGLVLFPVTVLIAVTAAALGPWLGIGSATIGVLASASLLYGIGHAVGIATVQRLLGPRLRRIQRRIIGNGIISVALARMLPLAPFSLVNLAAGASGLRYFDFIIGTVLGMAPGLVAMSIFGTQIADILHQPSWSGVVMLACAVVAWVALSIAAQFVVTWLGRRT